MFKQHLTEIIKGNDLDQDRMSAMIDDVFSGELADTQIAAMMAALATKGETFEELAGAARTMRRRAMRIQTTARTVVDTCGTGGDGANTFNISTTTAFVVAGCGVTVAKHGNRSVSSKCGSADVLETLGIKLDTAPEIVEEAVMELGIGFLFAPIYHGAMRYAVKARQEVGIRSIFNMLGPLTNPAAANCQLIGVYAPDLTEMFAQALRMLGTRRALVVHGHDGLDEISICAPTRVTELDDGRIRTYDIHPEHYFGDMAEAADIAGGDPRVNADITRSILNGDKGPCRDIVQINAAGALTAAGKAGDIREGIEMAAHSIDSGEALKKLEDLIQFTRDNG